MMVAVVIGLEATDVEPPHILPYHDGIYKRGEFSVEKQNSDRVAITAIHSVLRLLGRGRKYISRRGLYHDRIPVL
jgi:hypothetical protein